jgi:hypothetical protein
MRSAGDPADLIAHLARVTRLDRAEAEKVVAETLAFFAESVDEFVARRHAELQGDELKNDAIFARIQDELAARRFAAPALTARQIRRLIYG